MPRETEAEPDGAPESVADQLAAQLAGGGELVDHGGFDIDAQRALDKLAKFQLADPHAYILRWAEAGLIAGAERLRFDLDGELVCVAFDAPSSTAVIPGPALERLLTVLVTPTAEVAVERELLAQLAVGVLAAQRLDPRYLAIESVGPDRRGARMVYGHAGGLEPVTDAEPGTRVYFGERFDVGQRLDGALGQRREHELLRRHCAHVRTPIFVDNRRLEQEPALEAAKRRAPVVLDGAVIGEAGQTHSDAPGEVRFLARGLEIEAFNHEALTPGFVAAVEVALPRDLSRAKLARTPEFDAVLRAVFAAQQRLGIRAKPTVREQTGPELVIFGVAIVVGLVVLSVIALIL